MEITESPSILLKWARFKVKLLIVFNQLHEFLSFIFKIKAKVFIHRVKHTQSKLEVYKTILITLWFSILKEPYTWQTFSNHKKKILSACLSMWTESLKICTVWALINQVLPQCFRSYKLRLYNSSSSTSRYQRVNQYKPIDISESILSNRSVDFHLRIKPTQNLLSPARIAIFS